jgi:hypothetical protein
MLSSVRSGYFRLGQVSSYYVRLCHISPVYFQLGEIKSGYIRIC